MTRESDDRRAAGIDQFNRQGHRSDGARVAASLEAGLNVLRDLFYERMHFDVEKIVGVDSMLVPISEVKTQRATKIEIEVFQVAEAAWAAHTYGFTSPDDGWFLAWLAGQRLADAAKDSKHAQRLADYRGRAADDRRHLLMDAMLKLLPESGRTPLVLFRLVPLAVHIVAAVAFGDQRRADEIRKQQQGCLPAITDCRECRGRVLDNGELCTACGNPLWKFQWLNVAE
jgi:hypothetical protein